MSYLEYVNTGGALGMDYDKMAKATRARNLTSPKGFYGAFDGGYTSCLFGKWPIQNCRSPIPSATVD
jgi:hypothetical protein